MSEFSDAVVMPLLSSAGTQACYDTHPLVIYSGVYHRLPPTLTSGNGGSPTELNKTAFADTSLTGRSEARNKLQSQTADAAPPSAFVKRGADIKSFNAK